MRWHESKFWRGTAIAVMALLAGLILKLDTEAQSPDMSDEAITIEGTSPGAPGAAGSRRGRVAAGRLESMKAGGFIPWDTTRGIFLTLSENSDRIVMWDLGSDWETSINFKVNNSIVFPAGGK